VVAELIGSPGILTFAERVLKEIEHSLQVARLHENYLQFLDE
jgi:hypothetical protein